MTSIQTVEATLRIARERISVCFLRASCIMGSPQADLKIRFRKWSYSTSQGYGGPHYDQGAVFVLSQRSPLPLKTGTEHGAITPNFTFNAVFGIYQKSLITIIEERPNIRDLSKDLRSTRRDFVVRSHQLISGLSFIHFCTPVRAYTYPVNYNHMYLQRK